MSNANNNTAKLGLRISNQIPLPPQNMKGSNPIGRVAYPLKTMPARQIGHGNGMFIKFIFYALRAKVPVFINSTNLLNKRTV